ncbi:MAG: HAMP domain-containing sensor histidine kinase [Bacillota bacterium]|nr:HAMP domain-containing sensor histidine kinase [Bacillota bacterium]
MNLKTRFWVQSLIVLLSTIAVTVCAGCLYVYFYNIINSIPVRAGLPETAIVVLKDDNVIYQSKNFSFVNTKEMLMNISMNNYKFEYKDVKYSMEKDTFKAENNEVYDIIKLSPIINIGDYYLSLVIYIIIVFLITFLIASLIAQRHYSKNIIDPIVKLKKQTDDLRNGDLSHGITYEGYGEVGELSSAVEQFRIKILDSIYYQHKVDENRKFLISSISHDLRTPVTSIRGYIEGVLDGVADTEKKKSEYLKKALNKTNLINVMIEDLLLNSKLDLNQMPFEINQIDILRYMEDCVSDNIEEFERENKKIALANELPFSVLVNIDIEKFKRVVQNILDNAKKNIEEGTGQLIITLRKTHSSVILEFEDNGKGITEEDLPHIFERFYRADPARAIDGSSGLGLAIAKQIVEGLGGRIWAVSKIGEGTSIIISLKREVGNEKNIDH